MATLTSLYRPPGELLDPATLPVPYCLAGAKRLAFPGMERRWSAAEEKTGLTERTGQEPRAPHSPLRVIIADDDPLARTLVRAMIAGEESLELVGECPRRRRSRRARPESPAPRRDPRLEDAERAGAPGRPATSPTAAPRWRWWLLPPPTPRRRRSTCSGPEPGAFLVKGGSQEELVWTLHRAVAA